MPARPQSSCRTATAALSLLAAAACGGGTVADPDSREVPWTYGPVQGGATAEHVQGTGSKGGEAIAKGWQCRLVQQKRLTVQPYRLAATHALFGKVALNIGLFDKGGKEIGSVRSPAITATAATFSFELAEDLAAQLWDVVIWFVKV